MQQTIQRKTIQMVRPASTFRYFNTAYSRKQLEIHRLPEPKSGRGRHDRKHVRWTIGNKYSHGTSRTEFEIRKSIHEPITAHTEHKNYARL